jgi:serine/threonine protein kinase
LSPSFVINSHSHSYSNLSTERDVKIFDFGLAKELDPNRMLEDGTYNLTGDTGSLRYMAPEGTLGSSRLHDVIIEIRKG